MENGMPASDIPTADFAHQAGEAASLLKLLANECRRLVLCYLAEAGELSVSELMERVDLSQSALSQHLAKLREEGLVATRKEAQSGFYRVCDPRAEPVLALLHQIESRGPSRDTKRRSPAGKSRTPRRATSTSPWPRETTSSPPSCRPPTSGTSSPSRASTSSTPTATTPPG